jgi:hypothetical protein
MIGYIVPSGPNEDAPDCVLLAYRRHSPNGACRVPRSRI